MKLDILECVYLLLKEVKIKYRYNFVVLLRL